MHRSAEDGEIVDVHDEEDRHPPRRGAREAFMEPLGLSANRLGQLIGVLHNRISERVKERRGVTPDTALQLARLFSTTPEFWLNLQRDHDLSKARVEIGVQVQKLVHPLEA